jgi:hypothetical protein
MIPESVCYIPIDYVRFYDYTPKGSGRVLSMDDYICKHRLRLTRSLVKYAKT